MFFCPELLLPQFGGKFSEAWIADVRGIAFVKKKDAIKINIPELCNDIIEMLDSRGKRPEECLSLMLASRLVHGMIILFDHKITILLDNIIKFSIKCRIPKIPDLTKKPGDKIVSRKRKRKQNTERSLSMERVQVEQAAQDHCLANVVPLQSITLNELPLEAVHEVNDFDVLNFGDIGYSIQPDPLPLDDVAFPLVEEVESSKKRAPSDVHTTPTKKRIVEKPVTQLSAVEKSIAQVENIEIPMPPLQIVERPGTPLQVVETTIAPPPPERRSSIEDCLQPITRNDVEMEKKNRRKSIRTVKSSIPYCVHEKPSKSIDWNIYESRKIIPVGDRVPLEFVLYSKKVLVDTANFISFLIEEEPHIDDLIYRKQGSLSNVDSLTGQKFASRHTTLQPADLPSIVEAPHEHSPQLMAPVEEQTPLFPDPNISGLERRKSEVEVPHQFRVPLEVGVSHFAETNISGLDGGVQFEPLAESSAVPLPAEFVVSTIEPIVPERSSFGINLPANEDVRKSMRRQRHKFIRHTVKYWNYEENGKITLEDVCPKPFNRFNIAATFGDLLTMSKHGYVILNANENTLELETIERGPKLL